MNQSVFNAARNVQKASVRRGVANAVESVSKSGKGVCGLNRSFSSLTSESFINGTSAVYVEEMFHAWKNDPSSVHASWNAYFKNVEAGLAPGQAFTAPPSLGTSVQGATMSGPAVTGGSVSPAVIEKIVSDRLSISHLIRAYSVRGHEVASLDCLNIRNRNVASVPELDFRQYGFTEADLDRSFDLKGVEGIKGFLGNETTGSITLRDLIKRLQDTYTSNIGWEYMHITSREKCNWLRSRIELHTPVAYSKSKKLQIFDRLAYSDHFERYLANKFNTAKRFGLEGCETLVPGLKAMIDRSTELGVKDVVFGMPHRGRLNVLVNVIRKPMEQLLKEFQGTHVDMEAYERALKEGDWSGSGDVKYHLGTSHDRTYPDGRKVHLSLVANPSHLEAVNPVVVGKVRAKMDINNDIQRSNTLGVLLHGDAAFAGQGVVYETFLLSQLQHYGTGGTIHVICNNQVGFTTDPEYSRSTTHPSDLGKAFNVPIFHVNADDVESVTRVFEIASEYRQQFKEDVIIDLVGYRRYGHNELDQPSFTQPTMYAKIATHPSSLSQYQAFLESQNVATAEELNKIRADVDAVYAAAWDAAQTTSKGTKSDWLASKWEGFRSPEQLSKIKPTGVALEVLEKIGAALTAIPDHIKLHPSLVRILKAKEETIKAKSNLDWATAEALAFGSLLLEGNRVRLSGQDVERGTFSHRHAVLHDQNTNQTFVPLSQLGEHQAPLSVCNSPLSEYGVMGFELGYSLEQPNQLVLWEAQFGDFVNGAQIIIDQFLSAGETKWFRQSGLVLLLPHGMEGQGPEHSSCRLERFLQAVDDDEAHIPDMKKDTTMQIQKTNMQVVNCTTPANYFHVLRRQVHRDFRKPLVIATPKSLLRHKVAVSSFEDMGPGSEFQRVIPDHVNFPDNKKVRKVIFCSGKIYYELLKHREDNNIDDVALVRVEQIAPFPFDLVADAIATYPNAKITWCQEESRNMGAWSYVHPRMITAAKSVKKSFKDEIIYAGRIAAASPAVGSGKVHESEQKRVIMQAFE